MKKRIKNIIISLALVVLIVTGIFFYFNMRTTTVTETFSNTVAESVIKILQLSTLEYNYTDVVSHKESKKFNDLNIPFTQKRFLIKYTGYIKAGVDLSNVEVDIKDPQTINVTINHAQITDNVINEEDLYVYDEKESLFNQLKIADVYDILVDEKLKTETKLIKTGFLKEADHRSEELVRELLKVFNFENIVVTFH